MKFGKELRDSHDARVASGVACAVCGAAAVLQAELGVRRREHTTAARAPVRILVGFCPEHGGAAPLEVVAHVLENLRRGLGTPDFAAGVRAMLASLGVDASDIMPALRRRLLAVVPDEDTADGEPEAGA